jgi:homoserine kinase
MSNAVNVAVPATTANLGPGFDCLGAALSLHNQFRFSLASSSENLNITVDGLEAERVVTDESNLAYQAFVKLYKYIGQLPPPVAIHITLNVPLARGLGSSATAIAGGLVGANVLAGSPLSTEEVMDLAIAIEGHPDNVVPALIGGCRLAASAQDGTWAIADIPWDASVVPVLAIPDFELSTAEARRVLPQDYSRTDAIFNMGHLGLLLRGLETGQEDWLRAALQDRIHQPYRQALIHGYDAVQTAALDAGAYGLVISGAGPTLLALTHKNQAADVAIALSTAWIAQGISVQTQILEIDQTGAVMTLEPT